MNYLRSTLIVVAASTTLGLIAIAPITGLDFGGVLCWTQYVAAVATIAICIVSLTSVAEPTSSGTSRFLILVPMLFWVGYGWLQTIEVSSGAANWIAPGNANAYQNWSEPLLSLADESGKSFAEETVQSGTVPLTVARDDTEHDAALMGVLPALAFASICLFSNVRRVTWLLIGVAALIALHVSIALLCELSPSLSPWRYFGEATAGYGAFFNRNNAALHLNFGLAAAFGVLAWRLKQVIGQDTEDEEFQTFEFLSLLSDPLSIAAAFVSAVFVAALFYCGSRSGLLAMFAGLIFAFSRSRLQSKWFALAVPGTLLVIGGVAALVYSTDNDQVTTVERIGEMDLRSGDGFSDNARWSHWHDAVSAGLAYFPGGAGLGAYGYAYLPYQERSNGAWYQHADNLYLQVFVEQGIVGIVLLLGLACIIFLARSQLSQSDESVDQGLRVAFDFAMGAVVVSQFFDFGLLLPANLFLFVILCGAVGARASWIKANTKTDDSFDGGTLQAKNREVPYLFACAMITLPVASCSIGTLLRDAKTESLIVEAQNTLQQDRYDLQQLEELSSRIRVATKTHSSAHLADLGAELDFQRGKLQTAVSNSSDPRSFAEAYRSASRINRRKQWYEEAAQAEDANSSDRPSNDESRRDEQEKDTDSAFEDAWHLCQVSLSRLPLGFRSRAELIYLDFYHQDKRLSRVSLEQLKRLQNRSSDQLMRVARLAADAGWYAFAAETIHDAVKLNHLKTREALDFVRDHEQMATVDVIPDRPYSQIHAVQFLLLESTDSDLWLRSRTFLEQIADELDCDQLGSLHEKANCCAVVAQSQYRIGHTEESIELFRRAVDYEPGNPVLRIQLIDYLRQTGSKGEALLEARRASASFESDRRFRAIINDMAKEDLKGFETKGKE